jgi:hypothetical protein
MYVRICSAVILSFFLLGGAGQAQVEFQPPQTSFRSLFKVPDPRGEFVRLCAPHMVGRWAHPESVCGCLHDYAAATVEDADLREALLRGISETGVPTIETAWVPASKQSEIGPTFTKIAKPTLQWPVDDLCEPADAAGTTPALMRGACRAGLAGRRCA